MITGAVYKKTLTHGFIYLSIENLKLKNFMLNVCNLNTQKSEQKIFQKKIVARKSFLRILFYFF